MYLSAIVTVAAMSVAGFARLKTHRRRHRTPQSGVSLTRDEKSEKTATSVFSFADAIPVPLIILAYGGRLEFANQSAMSAYGDALGAIIRHPALQRLLSSRGVPQRTVTRLELDVPVRRTLQACIAPLGREEGPVPHFMGPRVIVALDDFTEVATVQRLQADFVAYASHELRTPLAGIIGLLETIRGPAAEDAVAQKEFLSVMSRQAGRMGRLIDRLLHLSRAQSLEHWRPETELQLREFWRHLNEEIASLSRQYGADIIRPLEVPEARLQGDQDQLIQMMLNLVENALKYAGSDGKARVFVNLDPKGDVLMGVEDDGPGVEPRHLPRLTERFYRINGGEAAGSGLGLAIVKHIVDRHAGRLKISNVRGRGLRCEIWFPSVKAP